MSDVSKQVQNRRSSPAKEGQEGLHGQGHPASRLQTETASRPTWQMKDKMLLNQQLPAGSNYQGSKGTGCAQTSSRSGERRKAGKKGQGREVFSGGAMRQERWSLVQKGPLNSGVPALKLPRLRVGRLSCPAGPLQVEVAMEKREVAEAGLDFKHHSVSPDFPPTVRWGN